MNNKELEIKDIEKKLDSLDANERIEAMRDCERKTYILPLRIIEKGLEDTNCYVRSIAMKLCKGRMDIPLSIIEGGLEEEYDNIRYSAMKACAGRLDISYEIIEKWLNKKNWYVRAAAMEACKGRENVPLSIIEKGLDDPVDPVCLAAIGACKANGISLSVIRGSEFRNHIYKRCHEDEFVVADRCRCCCVCPRFPRGY